MDIFPRMVDLLAAKAAKLKDENLKELTERQLVRRHGYLNCLNDVIEDLKSLMEDK